MSSNLQNTSDDLSLRSGGGDRTTKFAGDIPEYVEGAAEAIYTALHTFLRYDRIPNPTGGPDVPWVAEIRIPAVKETNPKTGKVYTNVEAAWFDTTSIEDIAAELASHWCAPPHLLGPYDKYADGGVYWTINPITPAYLENYGSRLQRRRTGTARDVDIIARYWLPIDADAVRRDTVTGAPLSVVSSTDTEKANIARLIAQVRDYLVGDLGWPEPVQVDTGNGFADFYALPGLTLPRCPDPDNPGCLKYDATADTLIRDVIHTLSYKFSNELGSIDDAVFNSSRIMKVPGTIARKGLSSPDRPHRASKIIYTPPTIISVTIEQLQLVADQLAKTPVISQPGSKTTPLELSLTDNGRAPSKPKGTGGPRGAGGPVEPRDEPERARRLQRAKAYVTTADPAVSGQHGHDTTFRTL